VIEINNQYLTRLKTNNFILAEGDQALEWKFESRFFIDLFTATFFKRGYWEELYYLLNAHSRK